MMIQRKRKKKKTAKNLKNQLFPKIPQVEKLIQTPTIKNLLDSQPRRLVLDSIRKFLDNIRHLPTKEMEKVEFSLESLSQRVKDIVLEKARPSLRPVINATGVILHTGLGRALLSQEAEKALLNVSSNYSNLEIDNVNNRRTDRLNHIEPLLCALTNAQAATVVNNNAAAVFLALNTFAFRKEVIVSRGQLVEIGGSFRMPEIMKASGAKLVEVGTTNITYLSDYEKAITERTSMLLYVHTSNFKMVGFTQEVEIPKLVHLAKTKDLLVVNDLGSGAMVELTRYGLVNEPTAQTALVAGASLVTFSGDKLLGGPQAGIIVGKKEYIEKMKKNPLSRALRIDKLRLAGLEATLRLYLDEEAAIKRIPVLEMLLRPLGQIKTEAEKLLYRLSEIVIDEGSFELIDGFSQLGGGALPAENIPTKLISFRPSRLSPDVVAGKLRLNNPPIFARISKDEVLLDPRTLKPTDHSPILEAFKIIFERQ